MKLLEKFYIDGAWVDPFSTITMPVMNLATNSQIGVLSLGNKADVDRAITAAKTAFETFSQTTKGSVANFATSRTYRSDRHAYAAICFSSQAIVSAMTHGPMPKARSIMRFSPMGSRVKLYARP